MKNTIPICFILLLLLPAVFSYSLRPATESIYFEPGLQKTVSFTVKNTGGVSKVFRLEASPRSEAFSGIAEQIVDIKGQTVTIEPGEEHEFSVDITLPDSLPYGIHDFDINIYGDEANQKQGMIVVKTILGFRIKIYSLYPGKAVEGKLSVLNSPNIGERVLFRTTVRNIGTRNIENSRIKVDIYEDENLVESIYSNYVPIASKNVEELKADLLITEGYKVGEYTAKASIEYDGKTENAKYTQRFNVGELSMDILNITSRKFENNKVNKFDIDLESKWNRPADVYAELIIIDFYGTELGSFKTQTVNVGGWGQGVVPAYLDIKDIENDNYMLNVILHYEDKTSTRSFAVQVSDIGEAEIVDEMPGMPKQTVIIILLSALIGLLIIIVLMLFLHGRGNRRYSEEARYNKREEYNEEGNNKTVKDDETY